MLRRYLVYVREEPFALKFDGVRELAVIGGHPKGIIEMKSLIVDYFKKGAPVASYPARNKVRLSFNVTNEEFDQTIRSMAEMGMRVHAVTSLGRMMR